MPNSFVKYFPDVKKRSILYTGPPTTVIILLLVYTVHTYSVYCPDIVVWYIDRHLFCSGHKSVFYTNIYLQIVICLLPPPPPAVPLVGLLWDEGINIYAKYFWKLRMLKYVIIFGFTLRRNPQLSTEFPPSVVHRKPPVFAENPQVVYWKLLRCSLNPPLKTRFCDIMYSCNSKGILRDEI